MVKRNMFTIIAVFLAIGFWIFKTALHYFVYGEPHLEFIPGDFNELWMRAAVVSLFILGGAFGDNFSKKMRVKQKQLEAARVYSSMVYSSQHIMNNLLNQMMLFKMEAVNHRDFDREVLSLYDNAIKEASELLARLSKADGVSAGPEQISTVSRKVPQPIRATIPGQKFFVQ